MTIKPMQLTVFRCAMCGKALVDGRRDKKTCSDICRKRLSRHRHRIIRLAQRAIDSMNELTQYLPSAECVTLTQQQIARIKREAELVARIARVQDVR